MTFHPQMWYRYSMATTRDPDGLTIKQRRFAEALPTAPSQAAAARIAGYTEKSIRKVATTNLANSSIMAVANQRIQSAAEAAGVTPEYILKGLKEHREEARALKQYAPANTALELLGRHLKLWGDDASATDGSAKQLLDELVKLAQRSRVPQQEVPSVTAEQRVTAMLGPGGSEKETSGE